MALPTLDVVQGWIDESPYNALLGIRVTDLTETTVTFEVDARPEWRTTVEPPAVHGGILAALLDSAADFSLIGTVGKPVPTIDLSVNYLRGAAIGPIRVVGRLIKPGSQIATAEAEATDASGKVVAIARGTFLASAARSNGT